MSLSGAVLLILAGIGAGVINSIVGAGSLVTFPTLLFLGYPPVIANVSNTVGLVSGSVMGAIGYRTTLRGRGPILLRLLVATSMGGMIGGALLVFLPDRAFDVVIPWLLLVAAVLAGFQPRIAEAVALRRVARGIGAPGSDAATSSRVVGRGLFVGVTLTAIYGGYFGAAQGVILLVILGLALGGQINELNGMKNVLGGAANLVAATFFIMVTEVDWAVAGIIATGATIGGGLGGRYGRRLSSSVLRVLLVGIAVIAAAVRFVG